jgi:hypothetical protein
VPHDGRGKQTEEEPGRFQAVRRMGGRLELLKRPGGRIDTVCPDSIDVTIAIRGHYASASTYASCFTCSGYGLAHGLRFRAKGAEMLLMVRVLPSTVLVGHKVGLVGHGCTPDATPQPSSMLAHWGRRGAFQALNLSAPMSLNILAVLVTFVGLLITQRRSCSS